ncbi:MAG TPA: PilZ domain-containing protein [Abditibacteriaceae bacterium]
MHPERRQNQRIPVSAWALVRGNDGHGMRFETGHNTAHSGAHGAARLHDLSANGLQFSLQHAVEPGQRLFIVFPGVLNMLGGEETVDNVLAASASIAVIGIVRRCVVWRCRDGSDDCHVGVEIVRHRFVYNA